MPKATAILAMSMAPWWCAIMALATSASTLPVNSTAMLRCIFSFTAQKARLGTPHRGPRLRPWRPDRPSLFPAQVQDLQAYPVTLIELAPSHPLAQETRPLEREVLAE